MEYVDIIEYGKNVFDFSPDEEFKSIEHLLLLGRKTAGSFGCYDRAAALMAERMAAFLDEQNATRQS